MQPQFISYLNIYQTWFLPFEFFQTEISGQPAVPTIKHQDIFQLEQKTQDTDTKILFVKSTNYENNFYLLVSYLTSYANWNGDMQDFVINWV